MPPENDLYLMLGEIKSDVKTLLQNQTLHSVQLSGLGTRVSTIETKSSIYAAGIATFFAVGIDIVKSKLGF